MSELQARPVVWVDGRPSECISPLDRACQYGDGVFETVSVRAGTPRFWDRHVARLVRGCARLGLPPPDLASLRGEAETVCAGRESGVLKIVISRGVGGRGYAPPRSAGSVRIISLHDAPGYPERFAGEGITLRVCRTPASVNPALAGIKHLNRLDHVMARREWNDPDVPEGLMLDVQGHVVSGTMTNVFGVFGGGLVTPRLASSGVEGTTRQRVLELAGADPSLGVREGVIELEELRAADELFVCNAVAGVWPVRRLQDREYPLGPVTRRIIEALGRQEC